MVKNGKNKLLINELLFFIHNKLHATTKDAVVDMCLKFYSLDEVLTSVNVLESTLDIRLSRRKGDDVQLKLLADIYDKLWSLDASSTPIQFLAADLNRIPRENKDSESLASTEQLLASIFNLKTTVALLQSKMVTRDELKASLSAIGNTTNNSISNNSNNADSNSNIVSNIVSNTIVDVGAGDDALNDADAEHASDVVGAGNDALNAADTESAPSTWALLASLPQLQLPSLTSSSATSAAPTPLHPPPPLNKDKRDEVASRQRGKIAGKINPGRNNAQHSKRERNSSIVIGKSVNTGLMSWKGADLTVARYIGRVAFGTSTAEIRTSLEARDVDVVSLEAIETKHERFASFKLVVKKSQLELIKKDTFWPDGVVVGRWWSAKSTSTESDANAASQIPRQPIVP